ncbi:MAG: hypothetical protein KC656_12275 [Myxococcales bacterium]|nr:hypothetical protein [Myxococcales bacterium]MCB9668305.1 hypothetical protein [Alphaproteobacteria bacterium]MCB9694467.1 hypothetical protein [Alphaproteobacteria bacterium]
MPLRLVAVVLLVACKGSSTPVSGECTPNDEPTLDVAQGGDWNMPDGHVNMGIPPQGGAPYAPFEIRLVGVEAADAYRVDMDAVVDGVDYATPPYQERFVCRNVGEEAGTRYTPDLHMRFFGTDPATLAGKTAQLHFEAWIGNDGPVVERDLEVILDWTLGPME